MDDRYEDDDVPPQNRPFSFTKAAKLVSFYMEQLFFEFTTQKSLGGVLLLAIFFFTTYCMAVVMWYDRPDVITAEGQTCDTLQDCFMTMLRLIFYDGTGLDYLNELVDTPDNWGYVLLLFLFVIFNGIVLINGLIGIFGATFMTADDRIEETYTKLQGVDERLSALTAHFDDFEKIFKKNMNLLTKQLTSPSQQPHPYQHGSHARTPAKDGDFGSPQVRQSPALKVSRNSDPFTRLSDHIEEEDEEENDGDDDDDDDNDGDGAVCAVQDTSHITSCISSDQNGEMDFSPLMKKSPSTAAPSRSALQLQHNQNLGTDT